MLKIYLDNSFLNRPFDDQTVGLNATEKEILYVLIELVKNGEVSMVNSAIIAYENSRNSVFERRLFVDEFMNLATHYQNVNDHIEDRALKMHQYDGIAELDALHCAAAEESDVDYFITCDSALIKKYTGSITVASPIMFMYYYHYEKESKRK